MFQNEANEIDTYTCMTGLMERPLPYGNFTCDSLQYYLFACSNMEQHVHTFASLGNLPGRDAISTFV